MKKLLVLFCALMFLTTLSAQEYDYEDPGDGGEDSYGSEDSSFEEDNSSGNNNEDTSSLLGEEPVENYDEPSPLEEKKSTEAPKNPNVPGEMNKWQLSINTNFVNVNHCTTFKITNTTFGLPFTNTNLAAGYQISPQIWIMAKFHFFANFINGNGRAEFLLGPGIRADFIRTDIISFFGGAFISLGSTGKTFLFSPEIYAGVEYNLNKYMAIGVITEFAYILGANNGAIHWIDFLLGPQLTIYF